MSAYLSDSYPLLGIPPEPAFATDTIREELKYINTKPPEQWTKEETQAVLQQSNGLILWAETDACEMLERWGEYNQSFDIYSLEHETRVKKLIARRPTVIKTIEIQEYWFDKIKEFLNLIKNKCLEIFSAFKTNYLLPVSIKVRVISTGFMLGITFFVMNTLMKIHIYKQSEKN